MAPSPEISCSADNAIDGSFCRYMGADPLDMVCHYVDRVLRFSLCDKEIMTMKNTRYCPKCQSKNIIRVPDDAHRYLSNSICITKFVTVERVPVARYVCCDCGYIEEWVENGNERNKIKKAFD